MNDAEMIKLTQELVRTPSPTYGERECANYLESVMKPVFDSVAQDDMGNVTAILEGAQPGPTVLFNGHMDHVDPGAMENPYSGELVDAARFGGSGEAVYGRGACDMKGALASMIAAADQLRSEGFRGRLVMMAVVQEETGQGPGTRQAMKELGLRPDVAVIGESTAGDLCLGHRGKVEFELEMKGRTAHASNPSRGVNAILLMNRFLSVWPRLPMPEDPLVGNCSSAITNITCSPGRLGVVPDRCTLTFDNRFLPSESPDRPHRDVVELLEQLRSESADFVYELRRARVMPAYWVSPEDPYVELMGKVVAEATGRIPARRGWLFGTDGIYLVNEFQIPTVGFGPGSEQLAHTPMDHIPVADLILARRVYVEFVKRLAG